MAHKDSYTQLEQQYQRLGACLTSIGILQGLPGVSGVGVADALGGYYPAPSWEQVLALLKKNQALVDRKTAQGFTNLLITPLAAPLPVLLERLSACIGKHAQAGSVFRVQRNPQKDRLPARVHQEKQVWLWDTVKQVIEADGLVYLPRHFAKHHGGITKAEAIRDHRICAYPGWSISLAEMLPFHPRLGQFLAGRQQIELGFSPREYLQLLQAKPYAGESGYTLEDLITRFILRLEANNEISYCREEDNALWCVGNYIPTVPHLRTDLVPSGWWMRDTGRLRLDAHRPGNKLCTQSWGVSTLVRLGTCGT